AMRDHPEEVDRRVRVVCLVREVMDDWPRIALGLMLRERLRQRHDCAVTYERSGLLSLLVRDVVERPELVVVSPAAPVLARLEDLQELVVVYHRSAHLCPFSMAGLRTHCGIVTSPRCVNATVTGSPIVTVAGSTSDSAPSARSSKLPTRRTPGGS